MPSAFDVQNARTTDGGRAVIFEISGKVDESAPSPSDLAKQAAERKSHVAIFDLSRAETIDSNGLEWLEKVSSTLEPAGIKVRVVSGEGSKVRRILRLMRFDRFILVLATVVDALSFGRRHKK
jgi:anti-anti-sigma regulatory factor